MKVSGKVISTETIDGKMFMRCQMNGHLPKVGDSVLVSWGKKRTNDQNALMWLWLQWIFDNGAKAEGYADPESLHEAFKGRFLAKKCIDNNGMAYIRVKSTTELTSHEFTEYFDKIQQTAREYLNIDDSAFWREYANEHCSANQG